jgi:hypothetical protein
MSAVWNRISGRDDAVCVFVVLAYARLAYHRKPPRPGPAAHHEVPDPPFAPPSRWRTVHCLAFPGTQTSWWIERIDPFRGCASSFTLPFLFLGLSYVHVTWTRMIARKVARAIGRQQFRVKKWSKKRTGLFLSFRFLLEIVVDRRSPSCIACVFRDRVTVSIYYPALLHHFQLHYVTDRWISSMTEENTKCKRYNDTYLNNNERYQLLFSHTLLCAQIKHFDISLPPLSSYKIDQS